MPYSLRPTALLLPHPFYMLPDDVLHSIALIASATQQPSHRYGLRARLSESRGKQVAPCVRSLGNGIAERAEEAGASVRSWLYIDVYIVVDGRQLTGRDAEAVPGHLAVQGVREGKGMAQ